MFVYVIMICYNNFNKKRTIKHYVYGTLVGHAAVRLWLFVFISQRRCSFVAWSNHGAVTTLSGVLVTRGPLWRYHNRKTYRSAKDRYKIIFSLADGLTRISQRYDLAKSHSYTCVRANIKYSNIAEHYILSLLFSTCGGSALDF